jgi:hypothetical protein
LAARAAARLRRSGARAVFPALRRRRRAPPARAFQVPPLVFVGQTEWRNSFQIPADQVDPPGALIHLGTTQELSSSPGIEIFTAELRPSKRVYFEFEFGKSIVGNGLGTNHFWIHSPGARVTNNDTGFSWFDPHHEDVQRYTQSLDGRTSLLSANVYIRALEGRFATMDEGYTHSLDALIGYSRIEETYTMTNLNLVFSPGTVFPSAPLKAYAGLNSTYKALWQGPHVGIREEINGPYNLSFHGYGTFTPLVFYNGDGFDNIAVQSAGASPDAPNYTHSASGTAVEMNVSLGWRPVSLWRFEAGYSLYYYFSRQGTERDFFADGTTEDITLDYVRTLRTGIFLSASLMF